MISKLLTTTFPPKPNYLIDEREDDPMGQIKLVLTEANAERAKLLENLKKRKREVRERAPPSKKPRGE